MLIWIPIVLVLAVLERTRLRRRPAPLFRQGFGADLGWLALGYLAAGAALFQVLSIASDVLGGAGVPRIGELGLPRWALVLLSLLLIDLGNYLVHRLLHAVPWLWRLHQVHHSSRQLDWLATFRSHLLEQVLRRLLVPLLLLLVGVPMVDVGLAAALFVGWGALNHANLRLPLGALEALFVGPRLHRIHHVPATTGRNFGTWLSLWDRLGGTLEVAEPAANAELGVPGAVHSYPQSFRGMLVAPFQRP
jgi:sterol desaturase/sphingolipid hydroxylase (fatty acid hydroxylase superfamily)